MRKILWALLFFGAYVYVTTSDNEQFFVEKGKAICEAISDWFEGAELDFNLKKEPIKRSRRSWR